MKQQHNDFIKKGMDSLFYLSGIKSMQSCLANIVFILLHEPGLYHP